VRIVNAREHNLKSLDVDIPHGKFKRDYGCLRFRASPRWPSTFCFHEGQRRLPRIAKTLTRGPSCSRAGRPEVDAVYGIPPTVAIEAAFCRAAVARVPWATTSEVWALPAPAVCEARSASTASTTARRSRSAKAASRLRAQICCAITKGSTSVFLAPLGRETARASIPISRKWGESARVIRICVWTASFVPVGPRGPKLDRFPRAHHRVWPVDRSRRIAPIRKRKLRQALDQTLENRQGAWMHLLAPLDGFARRDQRRPSHGENLAR